MNVGGHIDHGYLTDLAHDAAVLVRMQKGLRSNAATGGRVVFMSAGALGDEAQCLACLPNPGDRGGNGAASLIQLPGNGGVQEGGASDLCRATWTWSQPLCV